MKKLLLILGITFTITSCVDTSQRCMENVQKAYPKGFVWKVTGQTEEFIVVDSCGAVYDVRTMNISNNLISSTITLKHCN